MLDIQDNGFDFHVDEKKVADEAKPDGVYVIRTSVPEKRLSAPDAVLSYKSLSQVERVFRSMKTVDLKVRPIQHRREKRVRAHIFLCMLAYYVEWHMREAWKSLLFTDEEKGDGKRRDPVAPAKRSDVARQKVHSNKLGDGTQVHGFHTLLLLISQIVRNKCRVRNADPDESTFEFLTTPSEKQQIAHDLLKKIAV